MVVFLYSQILVHILCILLQRIWLRNGYTILHVCERLFKGLKYDAYPQGILYAI